MNKLYLLILVMMALANAEDNVIVGNSISALITGSRMNDRLGVSETWYNGGIGGYTTKEVYDTLGGLLRITQPSKVWVQCGSNDSWRIDIDSTIALYDMMLQMITDSGATMSVAELPPSQYLSPAEVMIRNARIREWCIDNSIPLARNYELMLDSASERYMVDSFTDDGVHPNSSDGRDTLAFSHANATVPTDTFLIQPKDGNYHVVCLGRGRKFIALDGNDVEYRTANHWLHSSDSSVSFISYTDTVLTYDMFLQAKASSGNIEVTNIRKGTLTSIYITEDTIGYYKRWKTGYMAASVADNAYCSYNYNLARVATNVITLLRFDLKNIIDWKSYVNYRSVLGLYTYDAITADQTVYIADLNRRWGISDTASGTNQSPATNGQATWNNSYSFGDPGGADTTWGNGAFDTAYDVNSLVDSVELSDGDTSKTVYEWSIDNMMANYFVNDTNNYGFALYSYDAASNLKFYSDDDNPSSNGFRPYAVIKSSKNNMYTVTITSTNGTVMVTPDTLLEGNNVDTCTLIADADSGYGLIGWTMTGLVDSSSNGDTLILTGLESDVSITANYSSNLPPVVSVQPISTTDSLGNDTLLWIAYTGTDPVAVQWWKAIDSIGPYSAITDSINDTLRLLNLTRADSGWYRTSVSNALGSDTSDAGHVTILHLPFLTINVTGSGTVDTLPSEQNGYFEVDAACTLVTTPAANHIVYFSGDTTSTSGDSAFITMNSDKTVGVTFTDTTTVNVIDRSRGGMNSFRKSYRGWWR